LRAAVARLTRSRSRQGGSVLSIVAPLRFALRGLACVRPVACPLLVLEMGRTSKWCDRCDQ
jgi:hypothetical protein